ncbi:response regulator [Bdellovibrio svalbardensis]|uniref:Response regulator n=1 Tax=Bdellovibrio svalbardensis TaxID=2972972 RepID=A0ABT6DDB6_9BACT|nr:response regulator [Bdellovibrio svalbardensis]MDG0814837.1 response regulator [Bdellovibrio svalbardensis]
MKIRFAVVDDAAFLRELIKNIVTSAGGMCVGEAENGEEAVKLIQSTLPDLVFMDMVMPEKNGIEAAKAIKEFAPETKIIGCSTIDNEDLIEKAKEAGFDAYLTKPFTKDQILKAIDKVLPHQGETTHGRT